MHRVSAWRLAPLLWMVAVACSAQAPPIELGPWPDPVASEPVDDVETVPLPALEEDASARLEVLPADDAVGPPTVEQQARQLQNVLAATAGASSPVEPAYGVDVSRRAVTEQAASGPPDLRVLYDWPGQADAGPPPVEPAGDSDSVDFVGPRVVRPFRMLGGEIAPGTRNRLYWNASQTYAGGEMRTPIDVIHGDRAGPVLCLTAAVHGDELNGVEVVRRMMKQLQPERFAGTVIGVPVVNLFGFSRNSRYLPDRRDLNRFFPGSSTGSIASRIAHSFFDQVARHCDALVDMHTGSFDRINLPQVRADLRIPQVLEFTRGFGATPVLHSAGSRGMLRVAAIQSGIPAVTFEVGGPGELEPVEIEAGVQALLTLVHKLGMVRDSPEWLEPQAIFYESRWVRANRGGMLISDVRLGERVQRGQRIGQIVDPLESSETDIVASVSGRVIGMALNQVVLPGYAIFHLGEETSESGAVNQAASGQAALPYEEDAGRPPAAAPEAAEPSEESLDDEGLPPDEDFE
ncbi:succinylglutamate desuccinylase/aspartoacylase family protein [Aquimonas sp.]|uniref:succinylglutamate desuccinylase/aspartoacylase family protein n=1 Tax=Aquimonas sp. TaxID=1872588 RepID=UPI0037BE8554